MDKILHEYWPKLVRLADRNLGASFKAKIGPEDIAQTVCRTVLRRLNEGQFCMETLEEGDDLWKVLSTITLRKISNKVRALKTDKRDVARERALGAGLDVAARNLEPTEQDVTQLSHILETLHREFVKFDSNNESMSSALADILAMKLAGSTHAEIAAKHSCSEKTVQRRLIIIKDTVRRCFPEAAD